MRLAGGHHLHFPCRQQFADKLVCHPPGDLLVLCDVLEDRHRHLVHSRRKLTAVTDEAEGDDPDMTEIGSWGVDADDNIFALSWWSGQESMDIWIDELLDMANDCKPFAIVGESGVIRRASEPYLIKEMRKRKQYNRLEWLPTIGDKFARARSFQALASMGKIYFPRTAWADAVISQLVRFPGARYDDKVDTCGLIGRAINQTWAAKQPRVKKVIPIDARETIGELMQLHKTQPKPNARRIR